MILTSKDITMVDVSHKRATKRAARARGSIRLTPEAFHALQTGALRKGDALSAARLAGIIAAKRTWELIPLCHPIPIQRVDISLHLDEQTHRVTAVAYVIAQAQTGVEMEALQAVSQALLTIYDMCKAHGQDMAIETIYLLEKKGGASGDYHSRYSDSE